MQPTYKILLTYIIRYDMKLSGKIYYEGSDSMSRKSKVHVLAGFIKGYRTALHITQSQFARQIGLSQGTVSRMERGIPVRPSTFGKVIDLRLRDILQRLS